ncbi:MAG: DUF5711 family protein [Clostridia bacterium]|nr:DUF5711 family protein [Clostridia bacterium]
MSEYKRAATKRKTVKKHAKKHGPGIMDKINRLPIFDYDMMPIDDGYDEKALKKIVIPKNVKNILIILIICSLAVFLWSYKDLFSAKNLGSFFSESFLNGSANSDFPAKIIGDEILKGNISSIGDDVVYVSDTSYVSLSRSSRVKYTKQHMLKNPILTTSANYALIYSMESKQFQIESASEHIYENSLDQNIQAAAISDNGYYAIASESKLYASELTVYSNTNVERFKYSFSDSYVCDIDISSDGQRVCVSSVTAENGKLKSNIYLFDINSEEPVFHKNCEDIAVKVKVLGNDKALFIGTEQLLYMTAKEDKVYEYQENMLCSYDFDKNGNVLLVLSSENGHNCSCVVLNNSSDVISEFQTNLKVLQADLLGNQIALLTDSMVTYFGINGEKWSEKPAKSGSRNMSITDSNICYVLNVSEIQKF